MLHEKTHRPKSVVFFVSLYLEIYPFQNKPLFDALHRDIRPYIYTSSHRRPYRSLVVVVVFSNPKTTPFSSKWTTKFSVK